MTRKAYRFRVITAEKSQAGSTVEPSQQHNKETEAMRPLTSKYLCPVLILLTNFASAVSSEVGPLDAHVSNSTRVGHVMCEADEVL